MHILVADRLHVNIAGFRRKKYPTSRKGVASGKPGWEPWYFGIHEPGRPENATAHKRAAARIFAVGARESDNLGRYGTKKFKINQAEDRATAGGVRNKLRYGHTWRFDAESLQQVASPMHDARGKRGLRPWRVSAVRPALAKPDETAGRVFPSHEPGAPESSTTKYLILLRRTASLVVDARRKRLKSSSVAVTLVGTIGKQ